MADGGEGEDEIQFLRTVSAVRRVCSQGKGAPGHPLAGSGQSDSGQKGLAGGAGVPPGDAGGAGITKVCAGVRVGAREGKGACLCARVES